MSSGSLFRQREVGSTGLPTPLIVPSFSSRGFRDPIGTVRSYAPYTSRRCLVSAFDVYYEALPKDWRDIADFVILDSGGYEAYATSELSTPREWDVEKYVSVVDRISDDSNVLLVSFDFNLADNPFERQLNEASRLRDAHPQFDWDFLVKPESPGLREVDVDRALSNVDSLIGFAALGFVEDELGDSVLIRARNIQRVRTALTNRGVDLPIHVFGCLDPLRIAVYVLSGADIFDGLEWIRHAYAEAGLIQFPSLIIADRDLAMSESERATRSVLRNLRTLSSFELSLRKTLRTGELADIDLPERSMSILRGFVSALGVSGD